MNNQINFYNILLYLLFFLHDFTPLIIFIYYNFIKLSNYTYIDYYRLSSKLYSVAPFYIQKRGFTNLNHFNNKLKINSTPQDIIFTNDVAVIFLPNLSDIRKLKIDDPNLESIWEDSKYFMEDVIDIFRNLDEVYRFEIYFYLEGRTTENLGYLWSVDPFDSNYIIWLPTTYGYVEAFNTLVDLESDDSDLPTTCTLFIQAILNSLNMFYTSENFTFRWDFQTLLIIRKLNPTQAQEARNERARIIKAHGSNKRDYSTYTSTSLRNNFSLYNARKSHPLLPNITHRFNNNLVNKCYMFSTKVEPEYFTDFIDLKANKLIIPRLSFISAFSNPFYTARTGTLPNIVANTALFNVEMHTHFSCFETCFAYKPHHARYDESTGEAISSYSLYIVSLHPLKEDTIRQYRIQNIIIKVIDFPSFFSLYSDTGFCNMKFTYFIFVGFSSWSDITTFTMNNLNVSISGGDSSKRHLISNLNIQLNFLILTLNALNLEYTDEHLLFSNVNKKMITPGSYISIPKGKNSPTLNVSRLKNNPFSSFNKIHKKSFHSTSSATKRSIFYTSNIDFIYNAKRHIHAGSNNYSSSSNADDLVKPKKLSYFLNSIKNIIEENSDDLRITQQYIEEKWIEIAYYSFDVKSTFFKNYSFIFSDAWDVLDYANKKGIIKRNFGELAPFLADYKYIYLSFSFLITFHSKIRETSLSSMIGKNILFSVFANKYREKFSSFDLFCNNFSIDNIKMLKLGMIFIDIFCSQLAVSPVFVRKIEDDEGYYIKLNPKYIDKIKQNLIINPQSLPMISRPNLWGPNEYGGFLLNKDSEFKKGLITGSEQHKHSLTITKNMYDSVNYLNSLKFKVNTDFLNYIENEGSFILDFYKNNPDSCLNNIITLDIAKVLKDTPFYLNVNLDWRGRIYTQSFYLDYQGSDFSLAFINFAEGKKLTQVGEFYYYIYGANCYNENNISKKQLNERYNWVKDNLDRIYSLDKDFIMNAESPALFASFCLNLIKMKNDPTNYVHFTPVFMDATCSGIQHFAAMLLDYKLAYQVNLIRSESVQDFYSSLIPSINKKINESWKKDHTLINFSDIQLTRKELKRLIMTKTYNVTPWGMKDHLKSILNKKEITVTYEDKNGEKREEIDYLYYVNARNEDGYVLLDKKELLKLAVIIDDNIFSNYPPLNSVYLFLTQLAKVMITLGLPITWATPSGVEIVQHYNLSKIQKVTINFLGKAKKTVLRIWTEDLDKRKQVNAIIPNIIHSLDASHLFKVIMEWSKDKYILPIHDCFGTHPNDMNALIDIVKKNFVELYINHDFLKILLKNMNNDLKRYRIEIKKEKIESENKKYIEIMQGNKIKKLYLPKLPKKGSLDIKDVLKSMHMIT